MFRRSKTIGAVTDRPAPRYIVTGSGDGETGAGRSTHQFAGKQAKGCIPRVFCATHKPIKDRKTMPSESLRRWNEARVNALDEIEGAHESVGGSERGRRYATQQINYAYAAILSSQFQAFCRDLHSESIDYLVTVVPAALQDTLKVEFLLNRTLDRGNPHPGGIGSDFNRLGVDFWPDVYALHASNNRRRELLQELIDWRNAVAHQDFDPVGGDATLHLGRVKAWRRAVNALTGYFDRVMCSYLGGLMGVPPW